MIDWKEVELVEYHAGRADYRIITELADSLQRILTCVFSANIVMTKENFAAMRNEFIEQEIRRSRYLWAVKARNRRVLRRRLARVAHEERMARKRAIGAHDRYWRAR